jgi:hypothetical protein
LRTACWRQTRGSAELVAASGCGAPCRPEEEAPGWRHRTRSSAGSAATLSIRKTLCASEEGRWVVRRGRAGTRGRGAWTAQGMGTAENGARRRARRALRAHAAGSVKHRPNRQQQQGSRGQTLTFFVNSPTSRPRLRSGSNSSPVRSNLDVLLYLNMPAPSVAALTWCPAEDVAARRGGRGVSSTESKPASWPKRLCAPKSGARTAAERATGRDEAEDEAKLVLPKERDDISRSISSSSLRPRLTSYETGMARANSSVCLKLIVR